MCKKAILTISFYLRKLSASNSYADDFFLNINIIKQSNLRGKHTSENHLLLLQHVFYHSTFHYPECYSTRLPTLKFGFFFLYCFIPYHCLTLSVVSKLLFWAAMLKGCLLWKGWQTAIGLLFSSLCGYLVPTTCVLLPCTSDTLACLQLPSFQISHLFVWHGII